MNWSAIRIITSAGLLLIAYLLMASYDAMNNYKALGADTISLVGAIALTMMGSALEFFGKKHFWWITLIAWSCPVLSGLMNYNAMTYGHSQAKAITHERVALEASLYSPDLIAQCRAHTTCPSAVYIAHNKRVVQQLNELPHVVYIPPTNQQHFMWLLTAWLVPFSLVGAASCLGCCNLPRENANSANANAKNANRVQTRANANANRMQINANECKSTLTDMQMQIIKREYEKLEDKSASALFKSVKSHPGLSRYDKTKWWWENCRSVEAVVKERPVMVYSNAR